MGWTIRELKSAFVLNGIQQNEIAPGNSQNINSVVRGRKRYPHMEMKIWRKLVDTGKYPNLKVDDIFPLSDGPYDNFRRLPSSLNEMRQLLQEKSQSKNLETVTE